MKIMKRNNGKVFGGAVLLCALFMAGCSDGFVPSADMSGQRGNGSTGIVLAPEEMNVVELKSPTGNQPDENTIRNVWIVQYDANGTPLSCQYLTDSEVLELDKTTGTAQAVGANLKAEARRIYFIANAESTLFEENTNSGPAENEVKTKSIVGITDESDLLYVEHNTDYYLPMYGYWEGTSAPADNMTVPMKRTVAKVSLEINAELPEGDAFLLDTVLIRNVPKIQQYYLDGDGIVSGSDGTDAYPAESDVTVHEDLSEYYAFVKYDENSVNGAKWDAWAGDGTIDDPYAMKGDRVGVALNATNNVEVGTYYLPENARGVNSSVTNQWEKNMENAPGGRASLKNGENECYATYIEIHGAYKGNDLVTDVTYKIYLGENNMTDYNLYRNHYYKVTATIKGQNRVDTRINTFEPVNYLDYTDNSKPWLVLAANYHSAEIAWNASFTEPEGWSMPTTKDLMLMWIYESKGNALTNKAYCWTNEIIAEEGRWSVSLNSGHTVFNEQGSSKMANQQLRFIKYW